MLRINNTIISIRSLSLHFNCFMHFSSSVFLQFIGHEITHSKGKKKDGGSLDGGVSQLGMGSASYYGEFHG